MKIDQKSRAEQAKIFDLEHKSWSEYFYGPRTSIDAIDALDRLNRGEIRRDKSSRIHDIIKDPEKILHDVIVERNKLLLQVATARADGMEAAAKIALDYATKYTDMRSSFDDDDDDPIRALPWGAACGAVEIASLIRSAASSK